MKFLLESFRESIKLIFSLDKELLSIILTSIKVSGTAILMASFTGVGLAIWIYKIKTPFKKCIIPLINTSMGLPPVIVGIFLYLLFSRSGPLGFMGLLYTPTAMIIAQWILATPIIAGISYGALSSSNPSIRLTALSLGASEFQATLKVIKEMRFVILSSIVAGLGRIIGEVGTVLIVGGNIAGYTRVMTTTIVLESDRGDFILAIALGIILLIISLIVNISLYILQRRGET